MPREQVIVADETDLAFGSPEGADIVLLEKPPRYWRARKARAVQCGNREAAAEADLALRAARIEKAIKAESDGPPLPATVVATLSGMLASVGGGSVGA